MTGSGCAKIWKDTDKDLKMIIGVIAILLFYKQDDKREMECLTRKRKDREHALANPDLDENDKDNLQTQWDLTIQYNIECEMMLEKWNALSEGVRIKQTYMTAFSKMMLEKWNALPEGIRIKKIYITAFSKMMLEKWNALSEGVRIKKTYLTAFSKMMLEKWNALPEGVRIKKLI
ncbi:hypothetical protein RhiirA5_420299 [Rhizophagus irregularis]|uniref:Uncharacterized protein n=1 Tax=Rhizophagus irregularis TaxID=588596 RepID=A0A2N0PGG1_9GLOM|nr:hypothetical protein RhiirA5_420299 [Rhizophagus irregularis]PKC61351.1 hypothetical protein RhiirA1_466685 [Rhizophagus irregularis]